MGNEECRFLPHQTQQFIEVVGCRCTITGGDAVGWAGTCQETELLIVDEFPLLTLLDALDGEAKLLFQLVVGIIVEVADARVDAYYRLKGVQRIFRRVLLVVDIRLRNDIVLFVSADQVDVFLTVVVDRSLQTQLLIDSLVELGTEVGHLTDKFLQILQLQREEDGRSDGTHTDRRSSIVQQICLTKVFAVAQKSDAEFFSMRTFVDDFCLTACHDEEFLLVLAFLDEEVAQGNLYRLKAAGKGGLPSRR